MFFAVKMLLKTRKGAAFEYKDVAPFLVFAFIHEQSLHAPQSCKRKKYCGLKGFSPFFCLTYKTKFVNLHIEITMDNGRLLSGIKYKDLSITSQKQNEFNI